MVVKDNQPSLQDTITAEFRAAFSPANEQAREAAIEAMLSCRSYASGGCPNIATALREHAYQTRPPLHQARYPQLGRNPDLSGSNFDIALPIVYIACLSITALGSFLRGA